MNPRPVLWGAFLVLLAPFWSLAVPATSGEPDRLATLEGRVTDERGTPLMGAIVSVFGAGLASGGLVAVTDEQGRFLLPQLEPGFYNLRAYLAGFLPSSFSRVEVEGGASVAPISMQLPALGEEAPEDADSEPEPAATNERVSELKWLLRHARRSILHCESHAPLRLLADSEGPSRPGPNLEVSGELGVLASQQEVVDLPGAGAGLDARLAFARVTIPARHASHWIMSAQLMESALSSWAASAEYVNREQSSQALRAGVSYGNHFYGDSDSYRPPEARLNEPQHEFDGSTEWFGRAFAEHDITVGSASFQTGMEYHYYSYLDRSSHATPRMQASWSPLDSTTLRGEVAYRVLAPGGEDLDLLARMVSAEFIGPLVGVPRGVRAQTTVRYQVALERELGETTAVLFRVLQEDANNQLVKTFLKDQPELRMGPGRFLVANQGDFRSRAVGLSLTRRFGSVAGTVGYTYGRSRALSPTTAAFEIGEDEDIHDLTTRWETEIERTSTRVLALYRLTRHPSLGPVPAGTNGGETTVDSRFSFQVSQVLPFTDHYGTRWELMVAVRNLFYEDLDSISFLDELAVVESPKRVLGGLTVRF